MKQDKNNKPQPGRSNPGRKELDMKMTFAEILKKYPQAHYTLHFKEQTLDYVSAEEADMDIDKKWKSYCPRYHVEVLYDDGTVWLGKVTAQFFRA